MYEVTVNYWAVLVAALSSMILGGLWYSPLLFGNTWVKLMGWSHEQMEHHKKDATRGYILSFLASLVTAYVLAHFVTYMETETWLDGLTAAFWIWLGFVATKALGSVLWEGKKLSLYFLNVAYDFIMLAVMAVILTLWQ